MKHLMVRYAVKSESVGENESYISAVFGELERDKPRGLRYSSYKLPDGVSFLHIATVDTADGVNPLLALDAFKKFAETIKERCVDPPVTTVLEQIGVYVAH